MANIVDYQKSDDETQSVNEVVEMSDATLQGESGDEEVTNKATKRLAEESDEEWKVVGENRKEKRFRQYNPNEDIHRLEVTITCMDKLPKSFAFAKLLTTHGMSNIVRVRYLSPFRIRVQFGDELNLNKLFTCEALITKGWRFSKDMEVSYSYGVIRDVELELEEKEIMENVSCPGNFELVSAMRLNKRDQDKGGWIPSEVVRLCFKGNSLPSYVSTDGLRLKVEPYVYPVSQCSRCWKLGHKIKACPYKKIVCPKCAANHENCETKQYKCINCSGKHMALSKSCPSYLKEKRLREIMAEFNCTYKKAITMYVLPSTPQYAPEKLIEVEIPVHKTPEFTVVNTPSYAEIIKTTADIHQEQPSSNVRKSKLASHSKIRFSKKKSQTDKYYTSEWYKCNEEQCDSSQLNETGIDDCNITTDKNIGGKPNSKITFNELLSRLQEVIFMKNCAINVKVKNVFKLCIEWFILLIVDSIADSSMADLIKNFFYG